jgi:drug/metabolite transporter (DMT)-like permease
VARDVHICSTTPPFPSARRAIAPSTRAVELFIVGGVALATAVIRIRRPRGVDAEMDVARGLGVVGMLIALGAPVIGWVVPTLGHTGGAVIGAIFLLGVALTIGAFGLLAWAANGPRSNR